MATNESLDVKKAKKEKKEKKRKRDKDAEGATLSKDESAKKHKKSQMPRENGASEPSNEANPTSNATIGRAGTTSESSLRQNSPFLQRTLSFYVTLSPCAHNFPVEGICAEHISPLLLTYYPPLEGVLLSYTNARLSDRPETNAYSKQCVPYARSVDEYAVTFTWLTADFVLFQPKRGTYLEGHVNLQNESLLGLMCYNYFNAVIERDQLPSDWSWSAGSGDAKTHNAVESGSGHFVDESEKKVEGRVVFRVRDFDAIPGGDANSGGTIHIYGTLLPLARSVASGSA